MILVTGGAGYIGSHYVLHERTRGEQVAVLDNLTRGHRDAVCDAPLATADTRDRDALAGLFRQYPIEAVVHFAAFAYVGESVKDPAMYWDNNVAGTHCLLEAMRAHQVDKLVFSSTCATYGIPMQVPIVEGHSQKPINPYGDTKLACERMIAAYGEGYGLRSVILRYFNAAGADPEGRLGETHHPETHLIPLALQTAAGKRPHLEIFGTDYESFDGTCIRDYIHVADLAGAHSLALQWLRTGNPSAVFNLGTEKGYSVRQVISACQSVSGRDIPVVESPRRAGDPPCLVASAALAHQKLGWRPRRSHLDDVVRDAWQWQMNPRY